MSENPYNEYPYKDDPRSSNAPEFTVTELSLSLKRMVEENFGYVRLRGEISGLKRAASGHMYLALKDENSVLDGVMWKGGAAKLTFRPEDGLEVICTGKLTTYPGRSKYQIVIDRMEPAGAGALMALLEERKKKLAAEGLFEAGRKKKIPYLPEIIGVVTSPTGAVIRDILHRLSDRFPRRVMVWPVLVQGEGAAEQIAAAIRGFNAFEENGDIPRPDVLIVARGGGSLEDLWSFNEEIVIRAVAESDIPLISAVGHETDTTLIDYASDLRAPTPTAAAEQAVPVRDDLIYTVKDLDNRLTRSVRRQLQDKNQRLEGLSRGLPRPSDLLALSRQRLDDVADRLPRALKMVSERQQMKLERVSHLLRPELLRKDINRSMDSVIQLSGRMIRAEGLLLHNEQQHFQTVGRSLKPDMVIRDIGRIREKVILNHDRMERAHRQNAQQMRNRLEGAVRLFDSLNYKRVLDRGFAVIRNDRGQTVTQTASVSAGDLLEIEFKDGRQTVVASDGPSRGEQSQKAAKVPPKKKNVEDDRQGSLL